MNLSVEMPTCEAEVPGALAKISTQIAAAQAHVNALLAFKKSMQAMCSHPRKYYSSDVGGGGDWNCPDCGWSR